VCHIHHKESTHTVCNGAKASTVPLTRIGRATANDQFGAEDRCILLQLIVVNVASLWVKFVRKRLEENGGCRDLLAASSIVPVGQVTTTRKVQAHDAIVGVQKGSVDGKVCRGARVRLDIHSPMLRV